MKPEQLSKEVEGEESPPVAGDVIGDTAYSERFVLKILLKLANLDTLKKEMKEKTFEDDLCTLWDMTAERDVVSFLLKHDVLNLFSFALPIIELPRIVEIIVGIIGNMCCQKEAVSTLLKMESFLITILEYMKTDDSLVLLQVLRLVNSCLYSASEEDLTIWMKLFKSIGYPTTLFFILKNSSHKDLLITSFENFNTVTTSCNTEKFRTDFFACFVTTEALDSLSTAFTEVSNQKDLLERDELERIFVITLQIVLNLVGFDKSLDIFEDYKNDIVKMVTNIVAYYVNKFISQKEIDMDLIDIVDSTNTVVRCMELNETCDPDKYFTASYSIWKSLESISKSEQNGCSFEDENIDDLHEFALKIKSPLSLLICSYIEKCSESNLNKVLDEVRMDYDDILQSVTDEEVKLNVSHRTLNYWTRLNS